MNIAFLILALFGCACGLLSSLYIVISLPAVIIWKAVQYARGNRDIL